MIELGMHNKSTGIPRRIGLSWAEFRRLRFVLIDKNINREPEEEGLRYFCPVCNNLRFGNHGPNEDELLKWKTLTARMERLGTGLRERISSVEIESKSVWVTDGNRKVPNRRTPGVVHWRLCELKRRVCRLRKGYP